MRPTDNDFPRYAHHRLEAFNLALDLLIEADHLCARINKPYRKIADQWFRAALHTFLLTCEGANRRSPGDKRYRFDHAHGECGEGAGAAEAATKLGLVPHKPTLSWLRRNARLSAMLNGLEQRYATLARSSDSTRARASRQPTTSTSPPPDPATSTSTSTSPPPTTTPPSTNPHPHLHLHTDQGAAAGD